MRLKLTLRSAGHVTYLPFNYQYPLSSAIYKILTASSPEYSDFLHQRGYLGTDGKARKLFTFSRLHIFPHKKPTRNSLIIAPNAALTLFVSSPMIQDFVQHLVVGLFQDQKIEIKTLKSKVSFFVESVETCAPPNFGQTTSFKALSPIVVTTIVEKHGVLQQHYYRPGEPGLNEAVRHSLLKKHQTATGHPPQDDALFFQVDSEYVERKGGPEKVMTLVRLKEGHRDQTNVKGFLAPFTLSGSVELMRIAWEAGLGDKCSMGFGCVEVVQT